MGERELRKIIWKPFGKIICLIWYYKCNGCWKYLISCLYVRFMLRNKLEMTLGLKNFHFNSWIKCSEFNQNCIPSTLAHSADSLPVRMNDLTLQFSQIMSFHPSLLGRSCDIKYLCNVIVSVFDKIRFSFLDLKNKYQYSKQTRDRPVFLILFDY